MYNLVQKIHVEVALFCREQADEQQRGHARAAWFAENGEEVIVNLLAESQSFKEWFENAQGLGYTSDDIKVKPYVSAYSEWYRWTSFELQIPVYGNVSLGKEMPFPKDNELPKAFVMPFIEQERKMRADAYQKRQTEIAERERQETEEKARLEELKKSWIAEFGSDYLKRATELGYNCQRQYVTERAALEHPDYDVDFDEQANWRDRACPSLRALGEVEELIKAGIKAQVIWLTEPIRPADADDDYCEYDWEACEAMLIQEYLGRYELIKIV